MMPDGTMLAAVLHGREDFRVERRARPILGPGEALIRVRRAGICGSDMHYVAHGRVGSFVPKRPLVLGHELAGEVAALGFGADPALLGARVAVDPAIPCGACRFCVEGRANLCLNMRFLGSASCEPHLDGGLAEFTLVPASSCHAVPESLGWDEAALVEPLAVGVHALARAGDVAGATVLVTGGGAIGQLAAMAARALGASAVAVTDPAPHARAMALTEGADAAWDPADAGLALSAEGLAPGGFDVAIEASGVPSALGQALDLLRRGGTAVQVGTLPPAVTLPLNAIMARELNLVGSFRFADEFGTALGLIASSRVQAASIITAVRPLAEAIAAMDLARARQGHVKVQLES